LTSVVLSSIYLTIGILGASLNADGHCPVTMEAIKQFHDEWRDQIDNKVTLRNVLWPVMSAVVAGKTLPWSNICSNFFAVVNQSTKGIEQYLILTIKCFLILTYIDI